MDNEGDALRTSMVYAISLDPELTPLRRGMCLKSTSKKQHSKGRGRDGSYLPPLPRPAAAQRPGKQPVRASKGPWSNLVVG